MGGRSLGVLAMSNLSPEVIERWRKDFEAYRNGAYHNPDLDRTVGGKYRKGRIESLWEHWVAARQSAVIELPNFMGDEDDFSLVHKSAFNGAVNICKKSIEDQGYRVEVKGD